MIEVTYWNKYDEALLVNKFDNIEDANNFIKNTEVKEATQVSISEIYQGICRYTEVFNIK